MLAKITLENFFSFGEATEIELNPDINILVGINGSGKSNFLKAIRLLTESIVGEGFEKVFLKDWGGFNAVGNFNKEQKDYIKLTYEFDKDAVQKAVENQGFEFNKNPIYEITIYRSGSTSYYIKEKLYEDLKKERNRYYMFMEMENAQGSIRTIADRGGSKTELQKYPQDSRQISLKSTELVLRQISDPDRFYPLFTLKRAIEAISVYDYFDTTLKSEIRQPRNFGTEERLLPNGQNLVSIILRIKNHHSLEYERIEASIKNINPHFKDINFDFLGSNLFLVLREQFLSKSISIEHISDGTLRYLILLSILFNPERGNLLCIDEPEIGLHPDMTNSIANAMKAAAKDNTQLIIATHSPLLLNAFDLEDVLVFEKDASNQTKVSIKSAEDFENWNENYLVGQLWLSGQIGGKRW